MTSEVARGGTLEEEGATNFFKVGGGVVHLLQRLPYAGEVTRGAGGEGQMVSPGKGGQDRGGILPSHRHPCLVHPLAFLLSPPSPLATHTRRGAFGGSAVHASVVR